MFESFVAAGSLAALVFVLGFAVSARRGGSIEAQQAAEADPQSPLRKAIRAHANHAEYAPMLALLCLALGQRDPSFFIEMTMYAAVAARVFHAVGMHTARSTYGVHPLRFLGALGTYATGAILAGALLLEAPEVW